MFSVESLDGRSVAPSEFDHMTVDEIKEHAATGHPEAVAILRSCERAERNLTETIRRTDHARRERRQRIASEDKAARERSEAMLAEMAAMRQAVERSDARADAAGGRESEALGLARRSYRVAVIATVAAVVSIVATVLVAVFA